MSIATMLRVSRNMPRKVIGAAIGTATIGAQSTPKTQARQKSKISADAEYDVSAKRFADLEEKVIALLAKPAEMRADQEEMLKAASSRVSALEEELALTKKVIYFPPRWKAISYFIIPIICVVMLTPLPFCISLIWNTVEIF